MTVKFQDYYAVLGVERNASPETIQSAYRRLARKKHPDVDKSAGSTERFQKIVEAYEVLHDPKTRARYDELGEHWKDGQEFVPPPEWSHHGSGRRSGARGASGQRARPFETPDGFSSFFEAFFGREGAPHGFSPEEFAATRRGHDVHAQVTIALEDALESGTRTVQLRTSRAALDEHDTGSEARTIDVKIPRGTVNGTTIRLRGQGQSAGGVAGDLLLDVVLAPHPNFRVVDHDLVGTLAIQPHEAALGARIPMPAPKGGEITVTVPAGSSSGRKLRLRGLGLPLKGSGNGDLIVELSIVVPSELGVEERKLYEELQRVSTFRSKKNG